MLHHGRRAAAGNQGGFSPADFGADLIGWWDASNTGSLTLSGADVTQWSDLSGNGEHVTQSNTGRYPQYSATGFDSAYPGLTFSDDYLICNSFACVSDNTITAVAVATMTSGAASSGRLVGYTGPTATTDFGFSTKSGILIARNGSAQSVFGYRDANLGVGTVTYSTPHAIISQFDGTNHTMYIDNVAGTPVAHTNNFEAGGILIFGTGYNSAPETSYWGGVVAEVFIVNRALTSQERTDIAAYFAKWGL